MPGLSPFSLLWAAFPHVPHEADSPFFSSDTLDSTLFPFTENPVYLPLFPLICLFLCTLSTFTEHAVPLR